MTTTTPPTTTRVTSPDGTVIAVFVSGRGRPLVLVPGTTSDHTTWRLVVPLLEPHATVYAVDRRGRGESGDGPAYALAREYEDVAAVVDAAAAASGGPVDLLGHSYGGNVAFGAATMTPHVRRLVLYEGWPVPDVAHRTVAPETMEHFEAWLAEGERERVLERFYREVAGASEEELAHIRAAPTWPVRVAAAHTIPREIRAFSGQAFDPAQAARITVPVLLLVGGESTEAGKADPEVVAAALPHARIRVLDGQAHLAYLGDPDGFAATVLAFLRGEA